jgi:hypothetical protein
VVIGRSCRASARFGALVGLALLMKALVPAGWMPVWEDGRLTIALCGGWVPAAAPDRASMDHGSHGAAAPGDPPMAHAGHGSHDAHQAHAPAGEVDHSQHEEERQGADQPCSFAAAGLSWTAPDAPGADVALTLGARGGAAPLPSAVAVGRGLAAPPPPPTGPPLLS